VAERLPARSQQRTLRLLGDDGLGRLVERFVAAWEADDVDAVVSLLTGDARLVMPPLPSWFGGREQVAESLRRYGLSGAERWRLLPASANGQPAAAAYTWDERAGAFTAHCVNVLTVRGTRIEEITAFLAPGPFGRFGLPESIAA
jgi:RNA polymerase sigma-70 factor (ECF subfamily)